MMSTSSSKRKLNRLKRKHVKSQSILRNIDGTDISETATTKLYVSNAGLGNGLSREHVYAWLSHFGPLTDIVMVERKPYCFVITQDLQTSESIASLSGSQIRHDGISFPVTHFIHYVSNVPTLGPAPSFSGQEDSLPDGLLLIPDYVTEQYESDLLHCVRWRDEDESVADFSSGRETAGSSMKHRSVRHFGYEFKYTTNNVNPDEPLEEGIPDICKSLCDRLVTDGYITEKPDQLTVNKYEAGQGIPPHVDTHSAFHDSIISLSLGSQVVMTFSHSSDNTRQVLLPRRSLLVMTGASRYSWTHGIVPRKTDVVYSRQGGLTLSYRQTRVSFTFRRLRRAACNCEFSEQCDSQHYTKSNRQSVDVLSGAGAEPVGPTTEALSDEMARKLESLHVHKVYDTIAAHFSSTRHSQWPRVAAFMSSLEEGSFLADIGCGNGKYLPNNKSHPKLYKIGFERSRDLAEICRSNNYPIVEADCLATPLRDNSVDACICIAVIHHLSTSLRRKAAVEELMRIVRPGGRCLIYVWAMEQQRGTVKSNYLKPGHAAELFTPPANCLPANCLPTLDGECCLPVHTKRTPFTSNDMFVPWSLRCQSPSYGSQPKSRNTCSSSKELSTSHVISSPTPDSKPDVSSPTPDSKPGVSSPTPDSKPGVSSPTPDSKADVLSPTPDSKPGVSLPTPDSKPDVSSPTPNSEPGVKLLHRYYHIFREGELESLCSGVNRCEVVESYYDQGNWCVILEKRS